jgi:WD40 repeat protein
VWDLDTGTCLTRLQGHTNRVNSVALHADGRRAVTGSDDRTVRVWDLDTGACLRTLEGHTDAVRSVALHADGRRAVSGSGRFKVSDYTVRVWDLDTGACLRTLEGHTGDVTSVALHADGRRLVTGSEDKTVRVWDLDTGACLIALEGHTGWVETVALHVDGRRAVTGSNDQTMRVWNLDTGACLGTWCGADTFRGLDLGKPLTNGRVHIAVGCGNDVLFFELMPPGPLTRTTLATWSPTRPLFATVLDTGAVTLHQWHASSAHLEELVRSAPSSVPIYSLRFSLDGMRLQVLTADNAERILDATTLQPAKGDQQVAPSKETAVKNKLSRSSSASTIFWRLADFIALTGE